MATKATLKTYFQTGDIPTQSEYEATIDEMVTISNAETVSGEKTFSASKTNFTGRINAQAGIGIKDTSSSNEWMGVATLVAGTVSVTNSNASGNRISLSRHGSSASYGHLYPTISGGGFTITSTDASDNGQILWIIFKKEAALS